jgi:uncharacterized PurR-regulated membrane protein YhhQ (DUF165 family)
MILVILYVFCMVLANLLVAHFGAWFSPINAFFLIGLDMVLRDVLHDRWKHVGLHKRMLLLITVSGAISYMLNPATGIIALASFVAFTVSMLVNTVIYHRVLRKNWMYRSNVSNVGGSAADSILFPTIAFGAFLPEIVMLQFTLKILGGIFWSYLFSKYKK